MSALQLQGEYLELARKYVDREDDTADNRDVIARWESVLTGLAHDPMTLSAQLDWVAKLRVLEGYRERDQLGWGDAKLRAIDLQYHDVRRDKGLYERLAVSGKVERLTSDDEVERAIMEPPEDTRAFFRGRCISRYPDAIAAASWDSVIMDAGRDTLQRIPMREPLKGTRAHVEELLDACRTAGELIDRLQA
jgi:proteasome accessory factor A